MARILIIDDDEYVRMTISQALEDDGHDVVTAINGRDGMDRFGRDTFDLVITDILMPEKEGIETVMEIRKIKPDIRIVVISGGGRVRNVDFLEMAKAFGADATIKKPFTVDKLCGIVNDCLRGGATGS